MKPRYVVDTNVLIAASAADPQHPSAVEATPADPALRYAVWCWLQAFRSSEARLVLDGAGAIVEEYRHKLGFNDYGYQVVLHKLSTGAVDLVEIGFDGDGNAQLPPALAAVVHDRADRKMVAACAEAIAVYGSCCIAFASDTDWHGWEAALAAHGIPLEPVLEAWSRRKYAEKLEGPHRHHRATP